jgi:hypothetical protein
MGVNGRMQVSHLLVEARKSTARQFGSRSKVGACALEKCRISHLVERGPGK